MLAAHFELAAGGVHIAAGHSLLLRDGAYVRVAAILATDPVRLLYHPYRPITRNGHGGRHPETGFRWFRLGSHIGEVASLDDVVRREHVVEVTGRAHKGDASRSGLKTHYVLDPGIFHHAAEVRGGGGGGGGGVWSSCARPGCGGGTELPAAGLGALVTCGVCGGEYRWL